MYLAVFLIVQVSGFVGALQWETVEIDQHGNVTVKTLLVNETMQASLTDCLCSQAQTSCNITYSNHTVTGVQLVTDNKTSDFPTSHRKCSHTQDAIVQCSTVHKTESYCHGTDVNRTIQPKNYMCSGQCVNVIWILGNYNDNTTGQATNTTTNTSTCDLGCLAPTVPTTTVTSVSSSHRPINVTLGGSGGGGENDNTGVIVGAVLGVCAAAFFVFVIVTVIYRRRKARNTPQASGKENQNSSSQVPDNNTLTYNSLYPETAASSNVAYSYSDLTDVDPRKENKNEYDTTYTDSDNVPNKNFNPDEYEYVASDTDALGYLVLDSTVTQTATTLNTRPTIPTVPVREEIPASQSPEDPHSEVEYENLQNDLYIDMSVHQPKLEDRKLKPEDIESLSSSSSSDSIYVNQNMS